MKISNEEKVRLAMRRGITDRMALHLVTRIGLHDIADIIADLNAQNIIKWNRPRQRFEFLRTANGGGR